MTWADTAALKALVETVPALVGKVFVTSAQYPNPGVAGPVQTPYVVLHPADGVDEQTRLAGPRLTSHPRFIVHTVGDSAEQAQIMGGLVKAALYANSFGVNVTVSGRRNDALWYDSPIPVQIDRDVEPAVFLHVAECGWTSNPA